jgi:hypothetical protein
MDRIASLGVRQLKIKECARGKAVPGASQVHSRHGEVAEPRHNWQLSRGFEQ